MVAIKSLALLAVLFSPAFSMVIRTPEQHHDLDVEAIIKADLVNDLRKQTNADRLAKGLGPLPPTRRSSGLKARASGTSVGTASTEDFGDAFSGPSVIRLRRPDGSEVGVITFPNGDMGDLVLCDPDTTRAQKFQFGKSPGQDGEPFEIYPVDDGVFGGKSPLLAARPRGGRPSLGPGSADFLHLGIGHWTDGGLLDIALPQNLLSHGKGPLGSLGSITAPLTGDHNGGLLNAVLPDVLGGDILGPITSGGPISTLTGSPNDGPFPAQGTIWTFDPKTRKLIAHYAHPEGHGVPTYFVTGGPCQHLICLTADVEAFRNAYGEDALELHALVTVL